MADAGSKAALRAAVADNTSSGRIHDNTNEEVSVEDVRLTFLDVIDTPTDTDGLRDDAVTNAKIAANAVSEGELDNHLRTLLLPDPNGQDARMLVLTNGADAYTLTKLDADDIPNLAAGKVTSGAFTQARIPNLNADKIATGTLDKARLPGDAITQGAGITVTFANGVYTIAATGGGQPARSHAIYSAVRATDRNFVESDFTTPATGETAASGNQIGMDGWTAGETRYAAIAIPATEADLTRIGVVGDPTNTNWIGAGTSIVPRFALWANRLTIGGVSHKVYRTNIALNANYAAGGVTWILT